MCYCYRRWPETGVHVLWECGAAQDVWAGCLVRIQKIPNGQSDNYQLFGDLMDKLTRPEFEFFLVQAWFIWNQRNIVIHGGSFKEPGWLNKRATEFLEEFHQTQVQLSISTPLSPRNSWQPPPASVYKVNFDAAIFSNLNCSGFGAAISVKGLPVTCSEEAEVLACRKALEFLVDAGFSNVIIEGDNENVTRAVSSSSRNYSWLGNIYEDVKWLMRGMQVVSVNSVKKGGNELANVLARHAKNVVDEMFWIEDSPPPADTALYH
ncbi:uncharacterized protein LOC142620606 [Castanea sativa]|uniref:uncharacterized protein LOC142620606 n=1 Tax=Castanea sativa TaxID=21020 RepID=UPI003F64F247